MHWIVTTPRGAYVHVWYLESDTPDYPYPRTRQIIRYLATATLRRLQLKQHTASNKENAQILHSGKNFICPLAFRDHMMKKSFKLA